MRQFIHHPVNIPIDVRVLCHHAEGGMSQSVGLGVGGLTFMTEQEISPSTLVQVTISYLQPDFITEAKVVWCRKCQHGSELWIECLNAEDAFQLRMFEQICHIENYRLEAGRKEGRILTAEEAASEWIAKYSAGFPNPGTEPLH